MGGKIALRALGALVAGIGGYYLGSYLSGIAGSPELYLIYGIGMAVGFALLGMLIFPMLLSRPARWIRHKVTNAPAHELAAGFIGLLLGLIFAAIAAVPLSMLPGPFDQIAPFITMLVFAYAGITTLITRKRDLLSLFSGWRGTERSEGSKDGRNKAVTAPRVLLDTSAIIDGRIADVSQTGFIGGTLVLPRFVLNELQHIADSADPLRRNRGRRGLDILSRMQQESVMPIEIVESDPGGSEVDAKLVKLAMRNGCSILTNDYNLNRVAVLQGVQVLNINELANALKTVVLPGEEMSVRVIQEGKEMGQGVGYLDDGTMIVIEGGRRFQGSEIPVTVTRVLQTVAGRMIFAHPRD